MLQKWPLRSRMPNGARYAMHKGHKISLELTKALQLDPDQQKSIIDIQNEAAKAKSKGNEEDSDEWEDEDISMDVDGDLNGGSDEDEAMEENDVEETAFVPMPIAEGGIDALRQKLHDKVERLRKGKRGGEYSLFPSGVSRLMTACRRTLVKR